MEAKPKLVTKNMCALDRLLDEYEDGELETLQRSAAVDDVATNKVLVAYYDDACSCPQPRCHFQDAGIEVGGPPGVAVCVGVTVDVEI